MWHCQKCDESVEDNFDICWNCQTAKPGSLPEDQLLSNQTEQPTDDIICTADGKMLPAPQTVPSTRPMIPDLDVLHKSRLLSGLIGIGLVSCLLMAIGGPPDGGHRPIFALGAGLFLIYFLLIEIQTLEIFPTYISINYILRKRRIERTDIDDVSMATNRVNGVTSRYILMRLKNGQKLRLGGFRESAEVAYENLKACESRTKSFSVGSDK